MKFKLNGSVTCLKCSKRVMFGQRKNVQATNNEVIVTCSNCKTRLIVNTTINIFTPAVKPTEAHAQPITKEQPNATHRHPEQNKALDGTAQPPENKSADKLPKEQAQEQSHLSQKEINPKEDEFGFDGLGI